MWNQVWIVSISTGFFQITKYINKHELSSQNNNLFLNNYTGIQWGWWEPSRLTQSMNLYQCVLRCFN